MLYEHYLDLTETAADRIAAAERLPEPARTQVRELLEAIDLLHREALQRLVERLHANGGSDAYERAAADPVVKILLGLYGLVDLGIPAEAEPEPNVAFFPADQLTVRRTRTAP
jgi:hypothetical protein